MPKKRLIYEYLPLIQIKANADGAEKSSLKLWLSDFVCSSWSFQSLILKTFYEVGKFEFYTSQAPVKNKQVVLSATLPKVKS